MEKNLQIREEVKKEYDKKTAAQAPVKMKEYENGQSAFSREAKNSFTRP